MHYLRNPDEIYRRSFEMVRAETDLDAVPDQLENIVVRMVHACGMPDIVADLHWHGDVAGAGRSALAGGSSVFTDCQMVANGIIRSRLAAANEIICTLDHTDVTQLARDQQTTRSAAAIDLWKPLLSGAVVAIGNAPTALFRLLELLQEGAAPPAVILAFPVGFVGAAESKAALIESPVDVPFLTLLGRRGGSAITAAAVNALGS